MRKTMIAGLGLAAIACGAVYAQSQTVNDKTQPPAELTAEEQRAADSKPDPVAIQRAIEAKARRIPARNLAAALRAAKDERSDRASTIEGKPDLGAMRLELRQTAESDRIEAAEREKLASNRTFAARTPAPRPAPGIRAMAASDLKSADEKEVDQARIPVLLPADPSVRDKLKVYGMKNVYTATAAIDADANLSITGTCNRVIGGDPDTASFRKRLAEQSPRLAGANASYRISRNDFGVDLSFSKFGCGYVMTIECTAPATDPRCAGDEYITGLAESMILANPDLAESE
ncbi:MAG: hypothetical protein R3C58_12270 [Parvularculaceae bacterium]